MHNIRRPAITGVVFITNIYLCLSMYHILSFFTVTRGRRCTTSYLMPAEGVNSFLPDVPLEKVLKGFRLILRCFLYPVSFCILIWLSIFMNPVIYLLCPVSNVCSTRFLLTVDQFTVLLLWLWNTILYLLQYRETERLACSVCGLINTTFSSSWV